MCAKKKKKMIYDFDEWLLPYKTAIDKRHEMIMTTKERLSVDGSLYTMYNSRLSFAKCRNL